MFTRVCAAIGSFVVALVAFAPGAAADPKAETVPLDCEGQLVEVAVNGNGDFTPGHAVDSTDVYVVQSIDATFTFTPTGGEPMSEHVVESKSNVHGDTVTCTFSISGSEPEGTFTGTGTVVVFITPSS